MNEVCEWNNHGVMVISFIVHLLCTLTFPCIRSLMVRVTLSPPSITPVSIVVVVSEVYIRQEVVFGLQDKREQRKKNRSVKLQMANN